MLSEKNYTMVLKERMMMYNIKYRYNEIQMFKTKGSWVSIVPKVSW